MDSETPTREEIYSEINGLLEEYRTMCMWFGGRKYLPTTDTERFMVLDNIERYGDRSAFKRSRELREWLLPISREQ